MNAKAAADDRRFAPHKMIEMDRSLVGRVSDSFLFCYVHNKLNDFNDQGEYRYCIHEYLHFTAPFPGAKSRPLGIKRDEPPTVYVFGRLCAKGMRLVYHARRFASMNKSVTNAIKGQGKNRN